MKLEKSWRRLWYRSGGTTVHASTLARLVGWLIQSSMEGDAVKARSYGLHREAERANQGLGQQATPASLLFSQVHWHITNDKNWNDKFYTTISRVPTIDGPTKMTRLKRSISNKAELRLLRIGEGDEDWLATFKGEDSFALLCPKTGLWTFDVNEARNSFVAHLNSRYDSLRSEDFRAYVVPLPTLAHTTWVGPPTDTEKAARSGSLKLRADIDGPRLVAHGLDAADDKAMKDDRRWTDVERPHRLIFHCFNEHRAAFESLFADTKVRVWAIEDQVPAPDQDPTSVPMSESTLPSTVHYVMTRSRDLQRADAPKREYVNAKNMWSYYSIWRYGGYHMDTGVFPTSTTAHGRTKKPKPAAVSGVRMPEPTDFGIVNESGRKRLTRLQLERWSDHQQLGAVAIGDGARDMFPEPPDRAEVGGLLPASLVVRAREDRQTADFNGDVWLLRSDRGGRTGLEAVLYFAQFWLFMQTLRGHEGQGGGITFNTQPDPNENRYRGASRAVVLAAALSALAPGTLGELWAQGSLATLVGSRAISATQANLGGITVPELGLDKTFFASHRAT